MAVFLEPSGCRPTLGKMGSVPALPKTTANDTRSDPDLYNLERTTLSLALRSRPRPAMENQMAFPDTPGSVRDKAASLIRLPWVILRHSGSHSPRSVVTTCSEALLPFTVARVDDVEDGWSRKCVFFFSWPLSWSQKNQSWFSGFRGSRFLGRFCPDDMRRREVGIAPERDFTGPALAIKLGNLHMDGTQCGSRAA